MGGFHSTFNGIVATNGYHPLWMLIIIIFTKLTSNTSTLFRYVEVLILISTFATYLSTLYTLKIVIQGYWVSSVPSLFICLRILGVEVGDMEIVLTIPLGMLFLYYALRLNRRSSPLFVGALCFMGSLVVLSRLDSPIFMSIGELCSPHR